MAGGPAISVSPTFQDEEFAALAIIVFTAADFGEADCTGTVLDANTSVQTTAVFGRR